MKYFITFLLLLTSVINAQKVLTLEEAIKIALKESYDIKSAEYSLERSQKSLEGVKLGLLSRVDMEFDIPNYSKSLVSKFNPITRRDEFYNIGNVRMEGRLFVRQPLIFSGGTISLMGSLYGREQFRDGQEDIRDYFSNLSIRLRQPLFTFNNQKANLERAEVNLEKSKRNYTLAERNIIYNVTSAFYNLYKAKRNVEIQGEKQKQSEISYNTALNKFKAGLIAEVEKMQLEVDLVSSKNQLLNAKQSYEEEKNNFKVLIGLNLNQDIDVMANLDFSDVSLNENQIIEAALKKSPDLLNAEDDIVLGELELEEVDKSGTIKANIDASYGINKNDEDFKSVFNQFEDDRRVVMTVSVPIFDWGKSRRETEAAEASFKLRKEQYKNLKINIRKDIISAINKIKSAKARLDVLSKVVKVAKESYDISMERFKSGKITSFDLSQMQIKLTDALLNNLSAIIDYKIAIANLERKAMIKLN